MIGHGLSPAGIVGQHGRAQPELPGEERDERRGRSAFDLQHLRERQPGVPEQGDLQRHSEPVAVVTALVDEVEVGRFQRVAPGELVRINGDAEQRGALGVGEQDVIACWHVDRPQKARDTRRQGRLKRRSLWTDFEAITIVCRLGPQNGRLGDERLPDILGYARVSTGDQDVAGQRMRLEQAGAIRVFTDVMSGKSMERPGLAELLDFARRGDTLAIVRLDRLGRSLGELLATVQMLRERHIALLSLEEKIDTSSAAGELIFHVFGAIAHFERRLISERTRDGIAAARAKGKLPGRQPLDGDKVSAALKLVAASVSPAEAARQLGIGRSTVYREMKRLGVARPV